VEDDPRMVNGATAAAWQERILELHNNDRNNARLGSLLQALDIILQGQPHGDDVDFAIAPQRLSHLWAGYNPEALIAELVQKTGIQE
jgi:hypothetical protein